MKLYTIGFDKKTPREFFTLLCKTGVRRIVDVRMETIARTPSFARPDDLRYLAQAICNIDYLQMTDLAPTRAIEFDYLGRWGDWQTYRDSFLDLMAKRHIEEKVTLDLLDGGCLLCSEEKPHHCHRSLIGEYLQEHWSGIEVLHL